MLSGTSESKKSDYWDVIISRYRSSGLSVSKFSEKEGVKASRLWYWLRKYKRPESSPSNFIELPSPSILRSSALSIDSDESSSRIELELPGGIVLRVWR